MGRLTTTVLVVTILVTATPASARNTFHELDVQHAARSEVGRERLLAVPFYMAGAAHPRVVQDLGPAKSNRRTNAFNKSDEKACEIAFLSALIALQRRAQDLGGDAIIDVRSVTKGRVLESRSQFRCVAGNVVANVALTGRIVKLAK